jgi:hypothetical protein
VFHPPLSRSCLITVPCFSVLLGGRGIILPRGCAGLCSQGRVEESTWCVMLTYSSANGCIGRFGAGAGSGEKRYQLFSVQCGVARLSVG